MTDTSPPAGGTASELAHTRRYVGVIVVEVLVLIGIWLVQRYFGS